MPTAFLQSADINHSFGNENELKTKSSQIREQLFWIFVFKCGYILPFLYDFQYGKRFGSNIPVLI